MTDVDTRSCFTEDLLGLLNLLDTILTEDPEDQRVLTLGKSLVQEMLADRRRRVADLTAYVMTWEKAAEKYGERLRDLVVEGHIKMLVGIGLSTAELEHPMISSLRCNRCEKILVQLNTIIPLILAPGQQVPLAAVTVDFPGKARV